MTIKVSFAFLVLLGLAVFILRILWKRTVSRHKSCQDLSFKSQQDTNDQEIDSSSKEYPDWIP